MQLSQILQEIPIQQTNGSTDKEIVDFTFDSRNVEEGSLFIAISGTQADGHKFIDKAIASGATAIMCEQLPANLAEGITYLLVDNSRRELARVSAAFYGHPARKIQMVGVTGTNGKSTSVTLLYQLFTELGYQVGLLSTIRNLIGPDEIPATHTTPDPKSLHRMLAEMVKAGCEYCFMEVSSHALVQHRVTSVAFRVAAFTNITHDHLDYHGSFREYILAKKILFDQLSANATALVNADDRNGKVMLQNTAATRKRFGLRHMAEYRAKMLENTFEGLLLELDQEEVWCRLVGSFNAYNLLMVYAIARELGLEKDEILPALSNLGGAEGRFQVLQDPVSHLTGIVDYAHTPDALQNVLETIQDINQTRGEIITVVGAGGDRDRSKRPIMAQIAASLSQRVILTSDNPRTESPGAILDEMMTGVSADKKRRVLRIENRREAIRTAVQLAQPYDIVLVAGKGHETYQEIKGVKHPFDDREELMRAF
ncbi:MAG: UDP-N-acetylmuramoyl-L-alanyl-D-glutamate--2,6-diaminopimelate ligase, partial [Bacteroidota bacterium]